MPSIKSYSAANLGTVDVPDGIFGARQNPVVLKEAVQMYEANKRQGTVNTLSRRFVNGTSKKSRAQKGTGGARHGDLKAPLFRGGGVAHGPHPRDFRQFMPVKARTKALEIALARKLAAGSVVAWSAPSMDKPSTKAVHAALEALGAEGSALLVAEGEVPASLLLSIRNLPRVRALPAREISAYDVVFHRHVVLLDGALDVLQARVERGGRRTARGEVVAGEDVATRGGDA